MKRLIPRKYERQRIIGRAVLRMLPDGGWVEADVVDLGHSGVAMFVAQGLTVGQLVEISFGAGAHTQQAELAPRDGRVVRSRSYPDGNIVGVEFVRPFLDAELNTLITRWARS